MRAKLIFRELIEGLRVLLSPRMQGYDLVRLQNVSLFVPTNDNLYDRWLSNEAKGLTLERHRELMRTDRPFSDQILREDVTKLLFLYIDTLFRHEMAVHLLDVGAWVGDVAISLARFAVLRGGAFKADCFDPSLAGALIPFNAELNGVDKIVTFHPLGVSLFGGPQIFTQLRGNSDGSRLSSIGRFGALRPYESRLIRTVTLDTCLPREEAGRHVIVKIDVEGIDGQLVRQVKDQLGGMTLIVEFCPDRPEYVDIGAARFVDDLKTTHTLFDICYCPRPSAAHRVDGTAQFIDSVRKRPYGYTDILAVPHTLRCHAELVGALSRLEPVPYSLNLA